ncbi:MAG TPA: hypothetical protein ACQGQI_11400 [Xylella sp.]
MSLRAPPPLPEPEHASPLLKGDSPVTNENTEKEKKLNEKLLEVVSLADSIVDSIKDELTPSQLESLREQVALMRENIVSPQEESNEGKGLLKEISALQDMVSSFQKDIWMYSNISSLYSETLSMKKEIEPLKAKTEFLLAHRQPQDLKQCQ